MFDSKEQEKKNAHALNNPRVGDVWSEMFANYTYVCDIDEDTTAVKALLVTGRGREAFSFATVGDFQDWLMYDTAPVRSNCLTGWTWCDLINHHEDQDDWLSEWEETAAVAITAIGEAYAARIEGTVEGTVESAVMVFE